jgi:hypothetical protein
MLSADIFDVATQDRASYTCWTALESSFFVASVAHHDTRLSQDRRLHFDRHLPIADRIRRLRGDHRLPTLEDPEV